MIESLRFYFMRYLREYCQLKRVGTVQLKYSIRNVRLLNVYWYLLIRNLKSEGCIYMIIE